MICLSVNNANYAPLSKALHDNAPLTALRMMHDFAPCIARRITDDNVPLNCTGDNALMSHLGTALRIMHDNAPLTALRIISLTPFSRFRRGFLANRHDRGPDLLLQESEFFHAHSQMFLDIGAFDPECWDE